MGTVKLNSDAGFLPGSGLTHIGAVARDHRGHVLFSLSRKIICCSGVEEAEARALLAGLQALSRFYRGPVIAETDCSFLVKELQPDARNMSGCFPVIHDVQEELKCYHTAQVIHARRGKNKLAHGLAMRARRAGDLHLIADVPDDLITVMEADSSAAQE